VLKREVLHEDVYVTTNVFEMKLSCEQTRKIHGSVKSRLPLNVCIINVIEGRK